MTARITLQTTARGVVTARAEAEDAGEAVKALADAIERLREAGFRTEAAARKRPTAITAGART